MKPFRIFCWTALFAAAMLTCSPAALASDGVTLINQATTVHGLPGCSPTAGYTLTLCHPGSYQLAGSLMATAGESGILISASNVSLDLHGFTLSAAGGSDGVDLGSAATAPVSGVAVFGGTIAGFSGVAIQGLNIAGNAFVQVHNLVLNCGDSCIVVLSGLASVDHVQAQVSMVNARFAAIDVAEGEITHCQITGDTFAGISLGGLARVADNLVDITGSPELEMVVGVSATSPGVQVSDNSIQVAGGQGLTHGIDGGAKVSGNVIIAGTPLNGATDHTNVCNGVGGC